MSFESLQIKRITSKASSGAIELSENLKAGELLLDMDFNTLYCSRYDGTWSIQDCFVINNNVSSASFGSLAGQNWVRLNLTTRDGSLIQANIPAAGSNWPGIVTPNTQNFSGNKTFDNNITVSGTLSVIGETTLAGEVNAGVINASSIIAPSITVTGLMDGNAASANKLFAEVNINGTPFDGSKEITTNAWGTKRNIKISNTANANASSGIDVDGTADFVLTIPDSMNSFAEILGTNLGSSVSPWTAVYLKEGHFYNTTTGYHKVISAATSAQTMTIPNASGSLIYKATGTTDTGDDDAPIYITSTGSVAACNVISVKHGGTGKNTLTKGNIIIGEEQNDVSFVAPTTKGAILISGDPDSSTDYKPTFASPSLSWSAGTGNGPTLKFTIGGAETTAIIPIATDGASGVVTASTTMQYFKGPKTFNDALTAGSTFSASGAATFNNTATFTSTVNINSNMKLTANSKIHGPSSTTSYATFTDTAITLTSPMVSLQGDVLVLDPSTYGASLPSTTDSKNTEGRVFFVLT